ncbi:uncharacterized protein K441DRAFT_653770, partial [Cenococcum geophilum 1.58]|uniref:uncharacterized protein n=1 Tax=Cenococcum geophilum 1.58 TaxID=794803 RepID=UPI00358EC29E
MSCLISQYPCPPSPPPSPVASSNMPSAQPLTSYSCSPNQKRMKGEVTQKTKRKKRWKGRWLSPPPFPHPAPPHTV